jgi:hypothetical protein
MLARLMQLNDAGTKPFRGCFKWCVWLVRDTLAKFDLLGLMLAHLAMAHF